MCIRDRRYIYDYASVFAGVNVENTFKDSLGAFDVIGVGGFRFLTPYLFDLDVRVDTKLRPRIGIGRSVMLSLDFLFLVITNIKQTLE